MALDLSRLKNLDFKRQLAFAYLTCERLSPNYVNFSKKYGFGTSGLLKQVILDIENMLFLPDSKFANANSTIKSISENIPEPANFDTILASSALDCCTAITETIEFIVDRKLIRLNSISTMATDTVSMFAHDRNNLNPLDSGFFHKVNNDHLIANEITCDSCSRS
jgi:uncharacterized protein YjaG (DUF416 family)